MSNIGSCLCNQVKFSITREIKRFITVIAVYAENKRVQEQMRLLWSKKANLTGYLEVNIFLPIKRDWFYLIVL